MDYKTFKLSDFEFTNDYYRNTGWYARLSAYLAKITSPRTGAGPYPVKLRDTVERTEKILFVHRLYEATGLLEESNKTIIVFHHRRLTLRRQIRKVIYLLFALPVSSILALGLNWLSLTVKPLMSYVGQSQGNYLHRIVNLVTLILFTAIALLFMFVVVRTAWKIASALTNKRFADSLCVLTVLFLIIELSRDDVLEHPEKRQALLARINDLARNTLFLFPRYLSRSEMNQAWSREHFKKMELYIRERERWIIAPSETTLNDLRRDFYKLAKIYISGNYGNFDWATVNIGLEIDQPTLVKRILLTLPRLLGIVLPLILMGFFLLRPELLPAGIGTNVLALIFIAWLLLGIDAWLKLGIISGVINLAKEIKSLK